MGILDVVGDHEGSSDGLNDSIGLVEGFTDSVFEGTDERICVGSTVNDCVNEGTDEGICVGDSEGHPSPNRAEISLSSKSPPSHRS